MKAQMLIVLMAGLWLVAPSASPAREWTDSAGKFRVEADLVEVRGDNVLLKKKSTGTVITVPIARLSKADQEYLQSLDKPGPKTPGDADAPTRQKPVPEDPRVAAALKTGGIVSIQVTDQPVSSVLARIEKATGNRVRIVDDFSDDDQQILSKRISLDLQKKTFWEAVDAVCTATGVHYQRIDDGTLLLSTEQSQFNKIKVVGKSAFIGPFQVYPGYDGFFDNAVVLIRLEPRFGEPQVRDFQAQITFPAAAGIPPILHKPNSMFGVSSNVHTRELTLPLDPDLPEGATKAQQIELQARLAIPSDWKVFTLPTLSDLAPKPVTVGKGTVYVTQAKLDPGLVNRPMFEVKLLAKGLTLDRKGIVLVDTAGNRVGSSSGFGSDSDGEQSVQLRFTSAKISGDPDKCKLTFDVPGEGEKTIGPLGDLAPKPASVGATTVWITRAGVKKGPDGDEAFEVALEFDGFQMRGNDATLVGSGGQTIEPNSWGGGGGMLQFGFDPAQIRGKAGSYRLRFKAPTKVTEHTLRATFNDVPLVKEE